MFSCGICADMWKTLSHVLFRIAFCWAVMGNAWGMRAWYPAFLFPLGGFRICASLLLGVGWLGTEEKPAPTHTCFLLAKGWILQFRSQNPSRPELYCIKLCFLFISLIRFRILPNPTPDPTKKYICAETFREKASCQWWPQPSCLVCQCWCRRRGNIHSSPVQETWYDSSFLEESLKKCPYLLNMVSD